jgi:hypothetical protein
MKSVNTKNVGMHSKTMMEMVAKVKKVKKERKERKNDISI